MRPPCSTRPVSIVDQTASVDSLLRGTASARRFGEWESVHEDHRVKTFGCTAHSSNFLFVRIDTDEGSAASAKRTLESKELSVLGAIQECHARSSARTRATSSSTG